MVNNFIIGSGFSAGMFKVLNKNEYKNISITDPSFLSKFYIERKNLKINKTLKLSSKSFGLNTYNFNHIKLHDRLISGGNSNIWGGLIDISKLSSATIKKLIKNKVLIHKINDQDGMFSNNLYLCQLRDDKKNIINFMGFKRNLINGYLESIKINQNNIKLNIQSKTSKIQYNAKKLILCIGVVQIIDLLVNSGLINKNDNLSLDEYKYKLQVKFTFWPKKINYDKNFVVRYNILAALFHYLGVQRTSSIVKLFNYFPIYVDQIFQNKKIKINLKIKDNKIIPSNDYKFGNSIHYCNLKINHIPIKEFLKKINKNISGFGMAFIQQKKPGPISQDIIADILRS